MDQPTQRDISFTEDEKLYIRVMASRALLRSRKDAEQRLKEESESIREAFDRQIGLINLILPDLVKKAVEEVIHELQIVKPEQPQPEAQPEQQTQPEQAQPDTQPEQAQPDQPVPTRGFDVEDNDDEISDATYAPQVDEQFISNDRQKQRYQPSRAVKRKRCDEPIDEPNKLIGKKRAVVLVKRLTGLTPRETVQLVEQPKE